MRPLAAMPYRFVEEVATADIAFEAWGTDVAELFAAAADATLNVMIEDLGAIQAREARRLEGKNTALDFLLFDFLQDLIYWKDAEQLLLRVPEVTVDEGGDGWRLAAVARGERLDPSRHRQRVDVKAVTMHDFRVQHEDGGWRAFVTLDI